MAYITFAQYSGLYSDLTDNAEFNRLSYDASRLMDIHTTGIDNVKKLAVAMPTNAGDAECVWHCCAHLIHVMKSIEDAENGATGYVTRADGTVVSKAVSSISSGTESISYSNGASTALGAAVGDMNERNRMYGDIVKRYLSGVPDSNGVNLLYMGAYPYVQ